MSEDKTLIYRDHRIELNHEFKFAVNGPTINSELHHGSNTFKSVEEAKAKIDQLLKIKGVKDKRRLNLPVIMDTAKEAPLAVIHGIHSVTGTVLGLPENARSTYSTPDLYPAGVSWIADLLEERRRLLKRLEDIREALNPYEINASRGYRIGADPDKYENALRELEKDHAEATKTAKELNDQPRVVYKAPV